MRIEDIAGYIRQARGDVCVVIGAGASKAAGVPLAAELLEQVEAEWPHCLHGLSDEDRKSYGKVMARLAPAERERFLNPILDASMISWGQIALAAIMRGDYLGRVLTFNFDLVLERALSLLGQHLPVYDLAVAGAVDVNRMARRAVVHLHGQGQGLVMLNTEAETRRHRDALAPLIADAVRNNLTIIAGYSGLADAAFELIRDEFDSRNTLIWLGYSKDPAPHLQDLLVKDHAHYVGGVDFDRTMITLADLLGFWPPSVIGNPMTHVLEELEDVAPFPVEAAEGKDLLKRTRSRLEDFGERWEAEKTDEDLAEAALVGGDGGDEAFAELWERRAHLSEVVKTLLYWRLIKRGAELHEAGAKDEGDDHFAQAINCYRQALELRTDGHEALYNWGCVLADYATNGDDAHSRLHEAGEKYAAVLAIKPDMHEALNNWGVALGMEAATLDVDGARIRFREAGEKYAAALEIKPDSHVTLNNWGYDLANEARIFDGDDARDRFREAGEKFAAALAVKPDMHEALNNWGGAILEESRTLDGDDRTKALDLAEEKMLRARELTNTPSYDLACVQALQGDADGAMAELGACADAGALPDRAHLEADRDLDALRGLAAFTAFLERLG